MHITPRAQTVPLEIQDRVRDQLARAMERRLAASQRFVEICTGAGGLDGAEEGLLSGRHGANLAPAAGVDRMELRGEESRWVGGDDGGVGFVGEEV